jgi:hypothetical protein
MLRPRSQPRRPGTRWIPLTLSTEKLGSVLVVRVTWQGGRETLFRQSPTACSKSAVEAALEALQGNLLAEGARRIHHSETRLF